MARISNYLEQAIMNLLISGTAYTPPTTVYCGLFTAFTEAADGDTFTEVSTTGTGYSRQATTFAAPSAGATSNSNVLTFDNTGGTDFGSVSHFGIFDASTSGNLLYWGTIVSGPKTIASGGNMAVAAGELDIAIAAPVMPTFANNILNHSLRNTSSLSQITPVIGLLTAFTNESTYTENNDAGLVNGTRRALGGSAPSAGQTSNSAIINWGNASGAVTVTHAAVFNGGAAGSGGTPFWVGAMAASVSAGSLLRLNATSFTIGLD
jgi:hypothetical protein